MGVHYREYAAPPGFGEWVECFWSGTSDQAVPARPVRPDGCVDILYSRHDGLRAVGTMTVQQCFDMPRDSLTIGVRFRPGMAASFVGISVADLTDRTVALEDLNGKESRVLEQRLRDADTVEGCVRVMQDALRLPTEQPDAVQRAIAAMAGTHGQADLDFIANQANLSTRQFRRRCLEAAGLTPRHLCRVLRFRYASALAQSGQPNWANIAANAGYYDQAHLIRDFREFTGETPMSVFSNTGSAAAG